MAKATSLATTSLPQPSVLEMTKNLWFHAELLRMSSSKRRSMKASSSWKSWKVWSTHWRCCHAW